jgi:hypothetical protein
MDKNLVDMNKWNYVMKSAYDFYNQNVFDISMFEFENLFFTDDLYGEVSKIHPDIMDILKDDFSCGCTILPDNLNNLNSPVIFLKTQSWNAFNVIRSLFHELTHVVDFYKFSKYYNIDIKNIKKINHYENYCLWSEFHSFYSENLYAYQFADFYNNTNNFESMEHVYVDNLSAYFLRERERVYGSGEIFHYDISRFLGYIAFPDIYDKVVGTDRSYVFEYLTDIFPQESQFEKIKNLYLFYVQVLQDDDILDRLNQLDDLIYLL